MAHSARTPERSNPARQRAQHGGAPPRPPGHGLVSGQGRGQASAWPGEPFHQTDEGTVQRGHAWQP